MLDSYVHRVQDLDSSHETLCTQFSFFSHCDSTAFLQNAETDQLLPLSVHKLVWCSVFAGKTSGCRFVTFLLCTMHLFQSLVFCHMQQLIRHSLWSKREHPVWRQCSSTNPRVYDLMSATKQSAGLFLCNWVLAFFTKRCQDAYGFLKISSGTFVLHARA